MDEHYMLPGSHERATGAECRCGWAWDRWNDRCTSQTERTVISERN